MKNLAVCGLMACALFLPTRVVPAQEPSAEPEPAPAEPSAAIEPAEHPAHAELRTLRQEVLRAVTDNDFDALLPHLHPDIVVVWQNAEVSRGREGVRDYFRRMLEGPDRVVESVTIEAEPRELTVLHGDDSGISFGDAEAHFVLTRGMNLDLDGPWSATLVREDDRWLIASFHASVNAFDNPLVAAAGRALYWAGGLAFVLGAAFGVVVAMFVKRRRPAA
ncbi:MAG: nuclear transport factor 2 family protein [Planctomycetaceae bacterium]